jgi:transcriptional regulator with XRE-family HTH domain
MELTDLRTRRQARGLTLDAVACASGISHSFLARMERGGSPLSPRVAGILAPILEASPEELLAGQQMLAIRAREALLAAAAGGRPQGTAS